MNAKGSVFKYPDNVDTDVIIPARHLNTQDAKELASHCMEDIDKDFVKKVKDGDIMVGGWNFGCGSSREHAPLCIKTAGISVVIAKSFARIFYRNSINIGLPIMECPEAVDAINAGDTVSVDFDTGVITDETNGKVFHAEPFPPFIQEIISAGGLMKSIKANPLQVAPAPQRAGFLPSSHSLDTLPRQREVASPAMTEGVSFIKGVPPMEKNIAVIWGDCSSPEIVKQTIRVLDKVAEKYGHTFHYTDAAMGGEAIDKYGDPLPQHELDKCLAADSVLLGAVGGPKWEGLPGEQRPEKGLLRLRAGMGLYSNNRPAKIWPQLAPASPLKPEIVAQGIDFIIVRELIGGVYFGNHETHTLASGEKQAIDSMPYAEHEIERIGRIGFETARKRRKKLCCVDKANVLDTSRLWRSVMHRLQAEYPDVEYSEMFVDNCAMQIVKNPAQFDVIVTENMFGDILSDEASMITGSIGMIPSSSLGDGTRGLYEPIHGSAPDIAGKDIVNPTACILSAAMMLRYSFGMAEEADAIETAVNKVLDKGLRTADNMSEGCTCLGCTAMGDAILAEI